MKLDKLTTLTPDKLFWCAQLVTICTQPYTPDKLHTFWPRSSGKHLLTICCLLSPNTLNQGVWTFSKRKRALFCCCRTSTYLLLNCGNPALFSPISLFPLLAAPPILASPSQASGRHILFARQNSFQASGEPVCNLLVPPVAFWTARNKRIKVFGVKCHIEEVHKKKLYLMCLFWL